ncbi:uncharacterized protein A1O5_12056 [Cladophialophora psammophila CBS 110553]|uniref:DUF7703 domain-containing protein n=1 Tax=Cladophialophora psammophila CBS 110553 TaxID=1182543 RepID=W9W4H0_9EURO|nr:uncharacterized protein A1O5_12056 [Cladophialophora psammophila CBS 110553]EXJ59431.1 hypothetical protein A1O5_12056 [Cladophialophora psammophila CBS 110553]
MSGETGAISVSIGVAMVIAGFFAISFYNFIYINVKIFLTFKRHRGLYFWSLIVASWGIPVHAIGFLLKFFELGAPKMMALIFIIGGWYCMVTGQSMVLYSRLHLVEPDVKRVRWILIMIIINCFLLHGVMTVIFFGANSSNPEPFIKPFKIYEKIQVTGFALQEFIISGLYIYKAWDMLRPALDDWSQRARRIMIHLIIVNVIIIIMDITLLGTEYANQYDIQTTYKGALYSIKLVMEFSILEQLCAYLKGRSNSGFDPTSIRYQGGTVVARSNYSTAVFSPQRLGSSNDKPDEAIELEEQHRSNFRGPSHEDR